MSKETIYHYTNLNAFKSIIENGEMWFTRVDCLNDFSEYNYYKDIFNIARHEYVLEREIKSTYDLAYLNSFADNRFIKSRDAHYKKTFTFSLSNIGDSIPMWNYYSDKSGIAIGFNKELLLIALRKKLNEYYAITQWDIVYNLSEQKDTIKSQFDNIIEIANDPELLKDEDITKTTNKVDSVMSNMWGESHMFKENSFEYENEFRITLCKFKSHKIDEEFDKTHYIVTGHNIKPVIKIKIAENWSDILTDIIISPLNQSNNIIENIHDFLSVNNANIDTNRIIKSKCPIRNL